MSKLYLVHLRPFGLHGIFLAVVVFKWQLSQDAMGQPGTSGTSSYLTTPCQSQVPVVPRCHGTTWDIQDILLPNNTLPVPGPSCPKLPDNLGYPGNLPLPYTILPVPGPDVPSCLTTRDIPGTFFYLTPYCQSYV